MSETPLAITRLGPYEFVRELATGDLGTVYAAREDDEPVTVAIIHPRLLAGRGFFGRLQRRVDLGRRLRHPNVLRTLRSDLLIVAGRPYCFLVMEPAEGPTLREVLRDGDAVPEELILAVVVQVAAGVEAMHAAGFPHRDLRAETVVLTPDRQARIVGLGVTAWAEDGPDGAGDAGSVADAAQDHIRRAQVDAAADLRSLGALLRELATASRPPRHPDVALFLRAVTDALLTDAPGDRFSSAAELRAVLEAGERSSWWAGRAR